MTIPTTKRPSQVILFSNGRTACHLFERMLFSNQPNQRMLFHPCLMSRPLQALMLQEDCVKAGFPPEVRDPYVDMVQKGVMYWEESLKQATEAGEVLLVHEHPQFMLDPDVALDYINARRAAKSDTLLNTDGANLTMAPKSLLCHPGTAAIITIRHPASFVPAMYRLLTELEQFGPTLISGNDANIAVISNLGWQRQIYDFYTQNGVDAMVVDADEYMSSPEYTRKVAAKVGLQPEACIFEWEKATEEEKAALHPMFLKLQETLVNSTGLVLSKVRKDINVDVEEQKWKERFGAKNAAYIRGIVDQAMPHYDYLAAHAIRA